LFKPTDEQLDAVTKSKSGRPLKVTSFAGAGKTRRTMRTMSAKEAKNSFELLIDHARAEPVQIEKHGRTVVVAMSVEEFQRPNTPSRQNGKQAPGTVTIGN
jgi:prevent-host-death family protein